MEENGDFIVVYPWEHRLPKRYIAIIEYKPGERLVVSTKAGFTIVFTRNGVEMRRAAIPIVGD